MRRVIIFIFIIMIPVGLFAKDPIKEIEKRVVEHTLKNGMKILILKRPTAPLVSFQMMFRAGGVDEVNGKTGLAHLFEHMMFKGTKTVGTKDYSAELPILEKINNLALEIRSIDLLGLEEDQKRLKKLKSSMKKLEKKHQSLLIPSEFDQIYKKEGGEGLNAFTGKDMTGFVVSLPSNKWELWPMLEADRMKNPVLREFYKERDVVMEERRMRYENEPDGKLWENFVSLAYQAHPYGFPTIGWMSDLRRLTVQDARIFFKKHYAPQQCGRRDCGKRQAKRGDRKNRGLFFRCRAPAAPGACNHCGARTGRGTQGRR